MSIVIEHDKRRQMILKRAMDVFVDEGYEDATYQKIADRCGIQRTTLYLYFKNKQDIFKAVVKDLMDEIETIFMPAVLDDSYPATEKLKALASAVMGSLDNYRKLLVILLEYLIRVGRSGGDPEERVMRRTIRLRRHLLHILQKGMKAGELKKADMSALAEMIYGMIEASIFRLTILNRSSVKAETEAVIAFIDSLKI